MSQTQALLSAICASVRGTVDEAAVQAIIRAGAGKKSVGISYQAKGEDRADRIAAGLRIKLDGILHGVLSIDYVLMQLSTSSTRPLILGEWAVLTEVLFDYCPPPGKWLNAPERADRDLGSTLIVTLVIWIESGGALN